MFKKLIANRIFRFLVCGAITAAFNVLLLAALIEHLKLNNSVSRNLANVASIEVSLLFSFFIYKTWVWSGQWRLDEVVKQQIPLYHLSCGASVAARSLVLFPILDWLGINYVVNNLLGIVIGSGINYIASDRLVFKNK
jgi:dolichol-phosphate mannosyltransferase